MSVKALMKTPGLKNENARLSLPLQHNHHSKHRRSRASTVKTEQPPQDARTDGNAGDAPKMKANARKKLSRKLDQLEAIRLAVLDLLGQAGPLSDYVPKYVMKMAEYEIMKIVSVTQVVKDALASTKGDAVELIQRLDEAAEAGHTAQLRLKLQVEEANTYASK